MFGKELVKDLSSEVSGNYHRLLMALLRTTPERDAYYLRKAMECVCYWVVCLFLFSWCAHFMSAFCQGRRGTLGGGFSFSVFF
jgi:hypothetical protein